MEPTTLTAPGPRFTRDPVQREIDRHVAAFDREHTARLRAERVASDLARLVAHEGRRAEEERERRLEAENVSKGMAALIALENARADRAEQRLSELLASLEVVGNTEWSEHAGHAAAVDPHGRAEHEPVERLRSLRLAAHA